MLTFLKVVQAAAKYGSRMVNWLWANKSTVLKWIDRGLGVTTIIDMVRQILGL